MLRQRTATHLCCRLGLLLVLLLAVACSAPAATPTAAPTEVSAPVPTAAPTAIEEPTVAPTEAPMPARFVPASATCQELEAAVAEALGVEFRVGEDSFTDWFSGASGTGCELVAEGTGLDFPGVDETLGVLNTILEAQGWTEDFNYRADGPTGSALGYRKGNLLCLTSAMWTPSADANCPEDEDICGCEVTPEQQLYTVSLLCLEGVEN